MANFWDEDTKQRVAASEKFGDPFDMAVGEYPDGRWWCRSLNEKKYGTEPFAVADSLAELEARVAAL